MVAESKPESVAAGDLEAVRWLELPTHSDERGALTAIEGGIDLPFEIKRVYLLHHTTADRGGHAHRETRQVVVALAGSCVMVLSNGRESRQYTLDSPERGLLLGPMLFIRMTRFSADAAVVVMASSHYDKSLSIRTWAEYLNVIGQ